MQDDAAVERNLTEEQADALVRRAMKSQAMLSVKVAALFIAILILVPLVNLNIPDLAAMQVMGFTLSWLFLGVLFYVVTVILSAYFVKQSDLIEAEIAKEEIK